MLFSEALEFCKAGYTIYSEEDKNKFYSWSDVDGETIKVYYGLGEELNPDYEYMSNLAFTIFMESNLRANNSCWRVVFNLKDIKGRDYIINGKIYQAIQYIEYNLNDILEFFNIELKDIRSSMRYWNELYPQRVSFVVPKVKSVLIFKECDFIVKAPDGTYFVLEDKIFKNILKEEKDE